MFPASTSPPSALEAVGADNALYILHTHSHSPVRVTELIQTTKACMQLQKFPQSGSKVVTPTRTGRPEITRTGGRLSSIHGGLSPPPPTLSSTRTLMNSRTEIHVWRTKRPSFAAVSVANQYEVGRDTDARNQLTLRVNGSPCSGQFSSVHVL